MTQRLAGAGLLALSVLLLILVSGGTTPDDRDGTAALLLIPLGIYLMTTRRRVFGGDEAEEAPAQESGEMCPGCRYNVGVPHPRCGGCDGWNKYRKGVKSWPANASQKSRR